MDMLTPEIKNQFLQLTNALSPENLHADGERSPRQARVLRTSLMQTWALLERKVGRKVDESEVYGWSK